MPTALFDGGDGLGLVFAAVHSEIVHAAEVVNQAPTPEPSTAAHVTPVINHGVDVVIIRALFEPGNGEWPACKRLHLIGTRYLIAITERDDIITFKPEGTEGREQILALVSLTQSAKCTHNDALNTGHIHVERMRHGRVDFVGDYV